jgi:hypothetical protein
LASEPSTWSAPTSLSEHQPPQLAHAAAAFHDTGAKPHRNSTEFFSMSRLPDERDYNRIFGSKYLSKDDVPEPVQTTITDIHLEEVRDRDGSMVSKYAVTFRDLDKPMLLNTTNGRSLSAGLGKDASNWKGAEVEVYNDLGVFFNGVQGGLRLHVLTQRPAKKKPGPGNSPNDMGDDKIPF